MSTVATVLLLGPARQAAVQAGGRVPGEAAGEASNSTDAATVGALRAELIGRYGDGFAAVLESSKIWVDGEPASDDTLIPAGAEVSILPPVSGG